MEFVIFVIGMFVGGFIHWCFELHNKIPSGTFTIDMRDPENDKPFKLDWDEDINLICTKKKIVLDVKFYEA